jgi:hypothetical protein
VCTEADYSRDLIFGISLLSGALSSCSIVEEWAAERGFEPDRAKY